MAMSVQFVVARSEFCCNTKSADGTVHETTRLSLEGAMLNKGREYLRIQPILSVAPGVMIMLTVLAINFVGDALRDALDPRIRTR